MATQNSENALENARKQMKQAFDLNTDFQNDENKFQIISYPKRVIEVSIPVRMDDGSVQVFTWYRSQHNDSRGAFKWGIRFHPDVNLDEVKALSIWMSMKTAVVDIPLGWGKWWIIVNPKTLSAWELERLSRGYVRELYKYIGPETDVPAPDVNTNPQIMAWMMDEYSRLVGVYSPGSFTGKPLTSGWSLGRNKATAQGWVYVLQKILELEKIELKGKKVIIQWAGNAGLTMTRLLSDLGATIIWVADSSGWIYNENGIDLDEVERLKKERKSVTEYTDAKKVSSSEILELPTDILIPAALENQITKVNAGKIQAKIILELANGPVTKEADEILFANGVMVIPDILANAWWVMVSYFEQVQNNMNYYWSAEEVEEKLKAKMTLAASQVHAMTKKYNTFFRSGAYMIAMKRIFDAMHDRGEI